jgi:prevent-host-death family protein
VKHKNMTLRIIPFTEAKAHLSQIVRKVYEEEQIQVLKKSGIPVAAIISMNDLERLYPEKVDKLPELGASAKRERAARNLRAALADMQKGGEKYGEEEVMADALQAIEEVRRSKTK